MLRIAAALLFVLALAAVAQAQTCPDCPKPTKEPPLAKKGCDCALTGVCGCGINCGCDLGVFAPSGIACQPRRPVVATRPAPRPVFVIRIGHGRCRR